MLAYFGFNFDRKSTYLYVTDGSPMAVTLDTIEPYHDILWTRQMYKSEGPV